jgi:hypothetical protein
MRDYSNQNQTNKSTHRLSHISPNTLQTFLRNHHKNIMKTKKFKPLIRRLKKKTEAGITCNRSRHGARNGKLMPTRRRKRERVLTGANPAENLGGGKTEALQQRKKLKQEKWMAQAAQKLGT